MFNLRKRDRTLGSSSGEEENVFGRSKKVIRSPDYNQREKLRSEIENSVDMEELKTLLENMRGDLKKNTEESRELRDELRKNTAEIRGLKEEMQRKENKWEMEKKEMMTRLGTLEEKIEEQNKDKRKLNLIIKGSQIQEPECNKKMQLFMEQKLGVKNYIKQAYNISKKKERMLFWYKSNHGNKNKIL